MYTNKKGNILRKNPRPISLLTYYSLKIKFVPFLKSYPATIPCKGKTIKWATKPPIKKEKKEEKRASEKDYKGLYSEGFMYGAKFAFQNRLG